MRHIVLKVFNTRIKFNNIETEKNYAKNHNKKPGCSLASNSHQLGVQDIIWALMKNNYP
jgi:hypothetical protein